MAAAGRRTDPPLERTLFEEGFRFDFFQAVRLFERLYPHRGTVGGDASPSDEAVRFCAHISLSFPASAIQETVPPDGAQPARMILNFMGLAGPLGVLPRHYAELLLERGRHKDFALRDFLDLFNHRLISLFYRAWEKYHFPVAYERAARAGGGADRFSQNLLDLTGMGTGGLLDRFDVDPALLLFHAGLISRRCRSAAALEGLLRDYFRVPVTVAQFTGRWLSIPVDERSRLGTGSSALGATAVAGVRFWDPQASFTVEIGPVSLAEFLQFLPCGDAFQPLAQLTRFFAGEELDFDILLVLRAAEVPECRLGETAGRGPRLGWSSWLKTRGFARDARDVVFAGRRGVPAAAAGAAAEKVR